LFDYSRSSQIDGAQLDVKRTGYCLYRSKLAHAGSVVAVNKHCCMRQARRNLFKELQPLRTYCIFKQSKSCDVASRVRQACDQSATYWIGDLHENDRNIAACVLEGYYARSVGTENNVWSC
jgi:hypothetical protein